MHCSKVVSYFIFIRCFIIQSLESLIQGKENSIGIRIFYGVICFVKFASLITSCTLHKERTIIQAGRNCIGG